MVSSISSDQTSQVRRFCQILRQLGVSECKEQVDLRTVSRWQIGGVADCLIDPSSTDQVATVLELSSELRLPIVIVGHGSNLFFSDRGVRVPILRLGASFSRIEVAGERVWCEAGAWVPGLALRVSDRGLAGAQHIIGIPGTIGGLVAMNGGSQRRGIGENVDSVVCAEMGGKVVVLDRNQCEFGYRRSIFQHSSLVVCEINLRFELGDRNSIRREMREILRSRRHRFPLKQPNCGSVFVSDPALFESFGAPGMIIERLGLKKMRAGDAEISDRHANFIVNRGAATAGDVLRLIHRIREVVRKATGHAMSCEVRFVHSDGRVDFAHNVELEVGP